MDAAIETRDLVKRYGRRHALDGLTLTVPRYAVLGLIGPNGAGKTTWMMTVAGFLRPTSGSINLLGAGPFAAENHSGRVTILPQDSELPLESRPLELLVHYGRLQGLPKAEAERSALEMLRDVNLEDRLKTPIRALSHGMRKRVMIAQCFIGFPEVVLLDEPLSGLDPREVARMRDFLIRRRGRQTMVISSHNLHDIEIMCTHVAFIENGRTIRMAALEAVTEAQHRLVYRVTRLPADLAALQAAVPDAAFETSEADATVTCSFTGAALTPDAVNAALVPALLKQTGLLSISQGSSLEREYLENT
jgi:ABC-2 type transport system ATP-binding protein